MLEPRSAVLSLTSGFLLTLGFAVFPLPSDLGVMRFGLPLPWVIQVVYPDAPRTVYVSELLLDIAFWSLVSFVCVRLIVRKTKAF